MLVGLVECREKITLTDRGALLEHIDERRFFGVAGVDIHAEPCDRSTNQKALTNEIDLLSNLIFISVIHKFVKFI